MTTNNQVNIGAAGSAASTANTTQYWTCIGSIQKSSVEVDNQVVFREAGTLSNLFVRVTANSVAGNTTVTTSKNTSPGNLTVTLGSNATGIFEDTGHTDAIAAGDKLCIKTVPGASTGTFTISYISFNFSATTTTDTVTVYVTNQANGSTYSTASVSRYNTIHGLQSGANTVELGTTCRVRKAGTLKHLSVNIQSNARTTNTTITLRKTISGAQANGNLTLIIGSGVTGFVEDNVNSDSIAAGDDIDFVTTTSTLTGSLVINNIQVTYITPTNDGPIISSRSGGIVQAASITTNYPLHGDVVANTTEASNQLKIRNAGSPGYILSNLAVYVSQNSLSGSSTLFLRKAGANLTLTVTIAAGATGVIEDTAHSDGINNGDLLDYQLITGAGTQLTLRSIIVNQRTLAVASNTLKYNLYKQIVHSDTLLYNLKKQIIHSDTLLYNLRKQVIHSNTIKYSLLKIVNHGNTLLYNLRKQVIKSDTLKYNIRQQIKKSNTLIYNILISITRVSNTNTLVYNLRQNIIKSNTLKYNIRRHVTNGRVLIYNIIINVKHTRITEFQLNKKRS